MLTNFKAPRLGLLVSSNNVVLEPVAMHRCLAAGVQPYVARYRVLDGARPDPLPVGFDGELVAADLLSDARVNLICTTGTAAGWQGFETEDALLAAIFEKTGIRTYSLVHAVRGALAERGVRSLVLVTPYGARIRGGITKKFAEIGITVTHRSAEESDNLQRAAIASDTLRDLCRSAAEERPEAILLFCANFDGSTISQEMTEELGIKVIDSVSEFFSRSIELLNQTN